MKTGKKRKSLVIALVIVLCLLLIGILYGIIAENVLRKKPDLASADDSKILKWYDAVVTEKYGQIGVKKGRNDSVQEYYSEVEDVLTLLMDTGRKDLLIQIIALEDQRLNSETRSYSNMFTEFLSDLYGGDTEKLVEDLTGAGLSSLATSYGSDEDIYNDILAAYYKKENKYKTDEEFLEQNLWRNDPWSYSLEELELQNMSAEAECIIFSRSRVFHATFDPLIPQERRAQNLEQIRYIIDITDVDTNVWSYTNGAIGMVRDYKVTLIDRKIQVELDVVTLEGGFPPRSVPEGAGIVYGEFPEISDLMAVIEDMIAKI